LTAATGTVTDGSGAANYANNLNCGWLIQPAGATIIRLTFTAFVLAPGIGLDVVTVYNGPNTGSPQLGRFLGNEFPAVLTATNGAMFIAFTSNGANVAAGWSANYTSSSLPVTTIAGFSPAFGPVGTTVTLTGTNFTGATAVSFNDVNAPGHVVNSATQITVNVPTGATTGPVQVVGINLTAVGPSNFVVAVCGASAPLTAATGTITDGSGAADYANRLNCSWLIQPPLAGSSVITLTFTAFATELGFDFVTVYNGPNATFPQLGRFSGATLPAVLTATNGAMFITFTSDVSDVAAGWSAGYTSALLPAPTITGFTPSSGLPGTVVTLTGTGFNGATAVSFNNVNASSFTVNSNIQATATVPAGATTGPVRLAAPAGPATSASNFTVPAHVIWTNSGWVPNQVPNANTDAIIAANYNTALHGSFIARSLIVNAGSTLRITNGQTVTINSVLDYAGNMVVESGGALIQTPASTLGNVGGQFRAERNAGFPGPPMAYNFWSSPIQNFRTSNLTSALPAFRLLYNEAAQQWQVAPAGATDFMVAGRGYTAVNAGSVTFTGVPNNGVLSLPTTRTAGLFAGANLAGNPYPSPILISDGWGDRTGLLEDAANSAFDGSAYVWVDNRLGQGNGTYRAVNASSFLDPGRTGTNQLVNHVTVGQGFFVRHTTGAAGNLNFANSHRIGAWGNTVLFRTEGQEAKHLVLELGRADGASDQFQLSLHPDFGPGFDRGHDAQKMDGPNGISLAALHDGSRQQLLALPEPGQGERFEVPLSVMANASGPHTFTAGRVNAQPLTNLFLEDRATGEFYYLQTGRSHTLNLQAGNYRDRFYLRRASEVVGRAQVGSSVRAFAFGGDLYIQAAENAQVTIYNTMGVALQHFAQVPGGGLRRLPIDFPLAGVYLVKVATASGTTEQRIWLDK